jgi:hypothetical protein
MFYFNCMNCSVCRLKRRMNSLLSAFYFRKERREKAEVQKLVDSWLQDAQRQKETQRPYPFGSQPFI